jgi:asparagine synthase (glutamine-hydrolysing)
MCGIVGIINLDRAPLRLERILRAAQAQSHRGPDDEGYLLINTSTGATASCGGPDTDPRLNLPPLEEYGGQPFDVAFGFRRLSIQDLSPAGHQPMSSADGRLWIVFNGEIYNYVELRSELSSLGHHFHTGTDTEVILASYQEWGEACLERFNGMFAFVVWNSLAKSIFAARDRFGEKPLHYVHVPGKVFAFASEMKALWAAGVVERRLHEETLALYESYMQLDSGEQTFYEGILRLPQAHCLTLSSDGRLSKRRYWDIDPRVHVEGKPDNWYAERFRHHLTESVRLRLRADVPVGSSLSGGLDSTTIVSVINRLLPPGGVQKTFSARFDDPARDEGKWIDLVTAANRVWRFDVWPTPERFFSELAKVFWHQEEPFSSTSIYAQWCVMRLAKENDVTVLLDGQGADEMLAGYHSYFEEHSADLLTSMNLPRYLKWKKDCRELHGYKPKTISRVAKQSVPRALKQTVKRVRRGLGNLPSVERRDPQIPPEFKNLSSLKKLLWWNTTREGLVELLRYADRNSMAHSREVRLPFLDHNLVEFVFRLPENFLMRNGWTKWILREAFRGLVPVAITERVDKLGYMPPQKRWLGNQAWGDIMVNQLLHMKAEAGVGQESTDVPAAV